MKLTNEQVLQLYEGIKELRELPLTATTSFQVAKTEIALEKFYEIIQNVRDELIKNNGEAKEDGTYQIAPDKIDFVNQSLKELLDTTSDYDLAPLSLDWFADFKITPKIIKALLPIIKE